MKNIEKEIKALCGRELTEEEQSFENIATWSEQELYEFVEIFQNWFVENDHSYDFYEYLRDRREDVTYTQFGLPCEMQNKLERLFHRHITDEGTYTTTMEIFEKTYIEDRIRWKKQDELRQAESMLKAEVQGGIN